MTLRNFFSEEFPHENTILGVVTGSYSVIQLPDVPCKIAMLKALSKNKDIIHIGCHNTVCKDPNDEYLPWEMNPGETFGWIPITNLNHLFIGRCGKDSYLSYWVMG